MAARKNRVTAVLFTTILCFAAWGWSGSSAHADSFDVSTIDGLTLSLELEPLITFNNSGDPVYHLRVHFNKGEEWQAFSDHIFVSRLWVPSVELIAYERQQDDAPLNHGYTPYAAAESGMWGDILTDYVAIANMTPVQAGWFDYGRYGSNSYFLDEANELFASLDHDESYIGLEWDEIASFHFGGPVAGGLPMELTRDGTPDIGATPVRRFDGSVILPAADLPELADSSPFGHTRIYTNRFEGGYDGPAGVNWLVAQMPYLTETNDGQNDLVVAVLGERTITFKSTAGGYETLFDEEHAQLTHDDQANVFTLTYTNGDNGVDSRAAVTQIDFYDFDEPDSRTGLLKEWTAPSGDVITATQFTDGRPDALRRTLADGTTEEIAYTYEDTTINKRRMTQLIYRRLPSGYLDDPANWVDYLRVTYDYYDINETHGKLNDLKSVTRERYINSAWQEIDQTHYRYWVDGQTDFATLGIEHGLKYVFGPAAYQRIEAAQLDIDTATDAQLAGYADHYFEYDPTGLRVTKVVTAATDGPGTTGTTFAYADNADGSYTDAFNHWKRRTTVTHADGHVETVYLNHAGQVLLRVRDDGSLHAAEFYQYDAQGRRVLAASPAAVDLQASLGTHEALLDLVGDDQSGNYQYLHDGAGLIELTGYDATSGQVNLQQVQQGDQGTPITTAEYTYTSVLVNGHTLYPLASVKRYPVAGGAAVTTAFSYDSWHSAGTQVEQRTTTLPAVGAAQHGSGTSATVIERFDQAGKLRWRQDERGYISHFDYDAELGRLVQRIDDVDMTAGSLPGDAPAWSTPTGGGSHLVTDHEYDAWGRLTRTLGPEQAMVVGGASLTARPATWRVHIDNDAATHDERRTATGYVDGSTQVPLSLVEVTTLDKAGQVVETVATVRDPSASGALTSSESVSDRSRWRSWVVNERNDRNQLTAVRTYHDIPAAGNPDLEGTHHTVTRYVYDGRGRRTRQVAPGGTITRSIYDGWGRVVETWVGTDDGCDCGDWDLLENVNMVLVRESSYDASGNLTQVTDHVDDTTTRTTTYGYDWRNRRTSEDGELDHYLAFSYDNLDRLIQTDRHDTTGGGTLAARSETKYDDRGRVYQTIRHGVDPATGTVGQSLTTHRWYDAAGQLIKAQAPGQRFTKHAYDALGRRVASYVAFDTAETASPTHADAAGLTGDTVLEQTQIAYDPAGHALLTTRYERLHDAAATTGALDGTLARITYTAAWHDGLGRVIATADYGTNAGSALTRPDTPPTPSDDVLVSTTAYDDAGRVADVTDPAGLISRTFYDDAGRATHVARNYQAWTGEPAATPPSRSSDVNRVTAYTYTADGQVATQTAVDPNADGSDADNQTTTYVYGTTLSDSELASAHLLRAVIYPDSDDPADLSGNGSDAVYDRLELTYNRQGQTLTRKDPREVVNSYDYDALGRLLHDRVTSLGRAGENVDGQVRRISRAYEVRGLLGAVTSHDDAVAGQGSTLNEVAYSHNDFGRLVRDEQAHDGAVGAGTPAVAYTYEDGSDATKATRLSQLTYPNGRSVHLLYDGHGTIDANARRVTALASASTRGTGDANVIADYSRLGSGTPVITSYPVPQQRLDRFATPGAAGTSGTYPGLDRFGRIVSQRWIDASGASEADRFHLTHGYDRASNRLFTEDHAYGSASQVYQYDDLHRLVQSDRGMITATQDAIDDYWHLSQQDWTLDALGNPLSRAILEGVDATQHSVNAANEYVTRRVRGDQAKTGPRDQFTTDTLASGDLEVVGSDSWIINTTWGNLKLNTGVADTFDNHTESNSFGIVLFPETLGPADIAVRVKPAGGLSGLIFGYKNPNDYWVRCLSTYFDQRYVIHMVDGQINYLNSSPRPLDNNVWYELEHPTTRRALDWGNYYDFPDGFPSGRVGFFANKDGTVFNYMLIHPDQHRVDMAGRWLHFGGDAAASAIDPASNRLFLQHATSPLSSGGTSYEPILLEGLRLDRFQATFAIRRESTGGNRHVASLVFNATDQDDFDYLDIFHTDAADVPAGYEVDDGQVRVAIAATTTPANMPALGQSDVLWARVTSDGTTVKVMLQAAATEPGSWSELSHLVYESSNFDLSGGMVGFLAGSGFNRIVSVDDLELRSDTDANGSYETQEHIDNFTISSFGYAVNDPTHDAAGNLTHDGVYSYTYDAWNRLVAVEKAFRSPSGITGTIETGSTLSTLSYDGLGRRISKTLQHLGNLTGTEHYYYDDRSLIEVRDGSGLVLKQHVWANLAGGYVDELVQVAINADPADGTEDDCEDLYWAMPDAHYSVLGLVDATGVLVERYTYNPYGQRTVYLSPGAADPDAHAPTLISQRVQISGIAQPYGLNTVGHQGLVHDEEVGLIRKGTRTLHTGMGRFLQRAPASPDAGTNLYGYSTVAPSVRKRME